MSAKLFSTVLLVLVLNRASAEDTASRSSLHVPNLNDNGVVLLPYDNKYYLRLDVDGTWREETVEEIAPEQLQVKGQLGQQFPGSKFLLVTYEAGPNGYVAKYSFSGINNQFLGLPPSALKSAAG